MSSEQGLSKIKPDSITNILTLRYDPSIKPNLPKKVWSDLKPSIQKPSIEFIEKSIAKTLRKQLDKFDKIKNAIKKIEDKYLVDNKKLIDERKFVLEMESFYVDLLKDKTTTAIMQGYDYIAFVEWNQKTKRIINTESKSSASDSIQKKNLRDRVFIVRLSKTIDFLTHGFRNLENQLC